ncbi:four helix bundle protein [Candidatus Shapirobacteria bacterium]|nr:four helix bundle protein [Candidatus Shapirobacteria bacterium]
MKYDLEERTEKFGESVIIILRKLKPSPLNSRIINQLVGSAGSIGANYCEANGSESKKDFVHKLRISLKEIKETKHWIKLLSVAEPQIKSDLVPVWQEAQELFAIFTKILKTCSINVP